MSSNPYTFENLNGRFAPTPPGRSTQSSAYPVGPNFYDDDDEDIDEYSDDLPYASQPPGGGGSHVAPWARGGAHQVATSSFPVGGRGLPVSSQAFSPAAFATRPAPASVFPLPVGNNRLPPASPAALQRQRLPIPLNPRSFSQPAPQQQRRPLGPPPPSTPRGIPQPQQQHYTPASHSQQYPSQHPAPIEEEDEFDAAFGDGTDLMEVDDSVYAQAYPSQHQQDYPPRSQPKYDDGALQHRQQAGPSSHRQRGPDQAQQRGVRLVPVSSLPDRYRSLFKFGCFNAVQSQCFETAMRTDENLVVSAPTGSGKTVLFELAIIRLLETGNDLKAVYIAPTKALCSERAKDWNLKFSGLGVRCLELTGDTDWGTGSFKELEQSRLIVTTPEKWDSLTRWKHPSQGNSKCLADISLFLIDEVHILREKRGSSLEVVVSRMRSFDRTIRFVALSATVPNVDDVGRWLRPAGDYYSEHESETISEMTSATVYKFGDEYRPCRLRRIIVPCARKPNSNPFQAAKLLEYKVFNLLCQHGEGKPALIFVPTRNGTISCAEQIAKEYQEAAERKEKLPWNNTNRIPGEFSDSKLQALVMSGVAFHHGGLSLDDRRKVEAAYLNGGIKMICSTSTLAVGVNLPAHTVVILGTKMFAGGPQGMIDYPDLDIIQMIGRAGRPQFDREGLAIILTEPEQQQRFEAITGGGTILESSLHENLTEHLNSEIALHTIDSLDKAQRWLKDSFLYVRVLQNPRYYSNQLKDATNSAASPAQALEKFVADAVKSLRETGLINTPGADPDDEDAGPVKSLVSTASGDVMSRNFLKFATMKRLMKAPEKPTLRELLELLCEADEFDEVRLRVSEKTNLKQIGQDQAMRFPVKEVKTTKDKVFVLIQANCGGIALGDFKKDHQMMMDVVVIFRHATRIAKSIVDLGLERMSGHIVKHGLEILRAMNAKAWEGRGSVLFRQLDKLGDKAIKAFGAAGIKTFEDLGSDPHRIERIMIRNPPFGSQMCAQIKALPKFTLDVTEKSVTTDSGMSPVAVDLEIKMSVEVGKTFKLKGYRSVITVSALVITSDMVLVDFRRTNIKFLVKKPQTYTVTALLTKPSEHVTVYLTCNEVVGVGAFATYTPPELPMSDYPVPDLRPKPQSSEREVEEPMDVDKQPQERSRPPTRDADEIDEIEDSQEAAPAAKKKRGPLPADADKAPVQLANGKWECNHLCKDKTKCSHLCCREGMSHKPVVRVRSKETPGESRPKSPVKKAGSASNKPSEPADSGFMKASTVFGKSSNVNVGGKSVIKKTATKKISDSDDDDLPEGDAMFAKFEPGRSHKETDSNSSRLYGDDELDDILANMDTLTAQGRVKPKAKAERERETTPDFPTWMTSSVPASPEPVPPPPKRTQPPPKPVEDRYEDAMSSSPESAPVAAPAPAPSKPQPRPPQSKTALPANNKENNPRPAPVIVKTEPKPKPAAAPKAHVPSWAANTSAAFGSSSVGPSAAWNRTTTSSSSSFGAGGGGGGGAARPAPRANINPPSAFRPAPRHQVRQKYEEPLFNPPTSSEVSSSPPRKNAKEAEPSSIASSSPKPAAAAVVAEPAPEPKEESSSEDEEDDTLKYLMGGGVQIRG